MGNCDPYSDSPEPVVVKQPQFTRVKEPTLLCNHVASSTLSRAARPFGCNSLQSSALI
jgi:hypothetical protein